MQKLRREVGTVGPLNGVTCQAIQCELFRIEQLSEDLTR